MKKLIPTIFVVMNLFISNTQAQKYRCDGKYGDFRNGKTTTNREITLTNGIFIQPFIDRLSLTVTEITSSEVISTPSEAFPDYRPVVITAFLADTKGYIVSKTGRGIIGFDPAGVGNSKVMYFNSYPSKFAFVLEGYDVNCSASN